MTLRGCVIACLLFAVRCCPAAAPPAHPLDLVDLGAPTFTSFSARDGVPESVIVSVHTDRAGFVWLGSSQGLARYDGHRWDTQAAGSVSGVLGELSTDSDGNLWVAFRDRGIARLENEEWRAETDAGMPTQHVRRLVDIEGLNGKREFWALTIDAGAFVRDHDRWIPAPDNEQLPRYTISLARTHSLAGGNRLWIGTANDGLWFNDGHRWQRFVAPDFDAVQIEGLLSTVDHGHEQLWITTYGSGIWHLDENGLHGWTVGNGAVPTNNFYSLAQTRDRDGDAVIWAASRDGLVRIHDGRAQVFDRRYGLPSNVIRGLSVWHSPDGIDVLWLATENGVARAIASGSPWQTVSLLGSRSSGVFGLLIEPDGHGAERLWVASSAEGIGVYENDHWSAIRFDQPQLMYADVRMLKRVDDTMWIGFSNGSLGTLGRDHKVDLVPDVPWPRENSDALDDMLVRNVDGHEERWFATRAAGLFRWRDGQWTGFHPNVRGPWRMTKIVEQIDAGGRSWLWATGRGFLTRFDGEHFDTIGKESGMPTGLFLGMSLLPDGQGHPVLWIGTVDHGVFRVDVSDPQHPTVLADALPPPPDPTAYGALRDSKGNVYICTNNGVQLLTPKPNGFSSRVFTRRDGMLHDECNTNSQLIDSNDRFWTGTLAGATVFDPSLERVDHQRKPLKLTGIKVRGETVGAGPVVVPAGARDLRIDYALLSWRDEDESSYRTQLLGYEAEPTEWTPQNFRSFDALPPGEFTLRVDARDYAGNVSDPLEIDIKVLPEWWQTPWAKALLALAVFLVAYAVFAWRTRVLRAQRRMLENVVGARTAELHEANARLVELSYKDALTGLANRRRLLDELNATPETQARTPTSLIFVDVDYFKAYNDRFGHPAGDEALRIVANALREHAPPEALVARYGGEEFACLLPGSNAVRARALAEGIRKAIEELTVQVPGTDQHNRVTISAGIACHEVASAADAHLLLRDADIALYQAKRDGRNCVRG